MNKISDFFFFVRLEIKLSDNSTDQVSTYSKKVYASYLNPGEIEEFHLKFEFYKDIENI